MGMIRKALSVSTLGAIDFRSDKERTARSARLTKRAVKKGNRQMKRWTPVPAPLPWAPPPTQPPPPGMNWQPPTAPGMPWTLR